MKRKTICVITGSRSEYDRLRPVLSELQRSRELKLQVVAAHMHMSPRYGLTYRRIVEDGFPVDACVEMLLSSANESAVSKSVGIGLMGFADVLDRLKPDAVLVLGDRTELLAVACACVCQRVPLAHLCGGEVTEGAVDDQVRHMLTKAAHLHFAANDTFAARILQMGEEPWRVCVSGSPAPDLLREQDLATREELEGFLKMDLSQQTALVAYHPVTLHPDAAVKERTALFRVLAELDLQYVITYPNADAGNEDIIEAIRGFEARNGIRVRVAESLGGRRFLGLMRHVRLMIGNSSSAIVFHAEGTPEGIRSAVDAALQYSEPECVNPYGDMHAAPRIVAFLSAALRKRSREELLCKKFHNQPSGDAHVD